MPQQSAFSASLQKLRKECGVTQEALAAHLGVSPQAVSKWENGSFPDGDLLPRIADFFEVSIDYLYGRAERERSIEQRVFDELHEKSFREASAEKFFNKILEILWAAQISIWDGSMSWYPLPVHQEDSHLSSEVSRVEGFSHFRLNQDLQYYCLIKRPPEGFAKRLGDAERFAPLFAFLGDVANLKILFFLLSLNDGEVVKASTIAKRLNQSEEKVEKALGYLCDIGGEGGNKPFVGLYVIDEKDGSEKAYCCHLSMMTSILMLLTAADTILYQPTGYQFQMSGSLKPWFQREDLSFLKKGDA